MELDELRKKLDAVDDDIAGLFEQRMNIVREIAAVKSEKGLPAYDPRREIEILGRIGAAMPDEIEPYCEQVFRALFEASKAYQCALANNPDPCEDK